MLLPPYKLPKLTPRDALVLASGPSFGDFELDELQNCGAVLYGCGHVSEKLTLDHYVLGDFWQHGNRIPTDPKTTTWVHPGVREQMVEGMWPEHLMLRCLDVPIGTHMGSSGNMMLSLACQRGHDRIFVLGFDGLSDSYATHRTFPHSGILDKKIKVQRDAHDLNSDDFLQIHVATLMQECYGNLWSLTPHTVLPLRVHPEIEAQPQSHLDRHSKLIVVKVPPAATIYTLTRLVEYWSDCHPRTPIVLVGSVTLPWTTGRSIIVRPKMPSAEELEPFNTVDVVTFW